MSSIEKLSIQGIRSFSPDDQQKQMIQFFTPLTLILGPNGTGKTTIIECLRYITTGDVPPNTNKGASFIYDPKYANETEVYAQVKLQFKDVRSSEVIVTRSLLSTLKQKNNPTVKTLDGIIQRVGRDGQKKSITTRCADLNKEMITSLGVSKAILNNVIFCHQEDSNWPLSEAKALKQKFDEIFAATRYIKALEKIRQIRIQKNHEIKLCAQAVGFLRGNKQKAEETHKKLNETETKVLAARDSIKKTESKIKPIEDKLDEIASKETKINRIHTQIVQSESQLKEMQKSQQDLLSKIKKKFDGTTDELNETIQDFKQQVQQQETTIKQLELEINTKQRTYQQLSSEASELTQQYGRLKSEAEQQNGKIKKRDEKLLAACEEYNLEDISLIQTQNLSGTQVVSVLGLLDDHWNGIADESKRLKVKHEERETEIQNKIDALRDSKTKLEQSVRVKNEQVTKNKNELQQVEQDLRKVDASSTRLNQLDNELLRAEGDLQNVEDNMNVPVVRVEIEKLKENRSQLETELRKLDADLERMHSQSRTQAELDVFRQEKTTKAETVKKILGRIDEPLHQLLGHVPSENVKYEVEKKSRILSDEERKLTTKLKNLEISLHTAESNRSMWMDQLKVKEEELKTCEEKLFQICGSGDFDQGLEQLQKSIKDYQDEKGALVGTKFVFSKFIEKLQKKDPSCPLCHRDFDEDKDVEDLVNELHTKLRLIPNQLENKEKLISENQQKCNSMLEFRPEKNKMETLCNKQIPELKQKVKQLGDQVAQLKKQVSETKDDLEIKQMDLGMFESIQSDVVMLDQTQNELRKLDKNIRIIGSKLSGVDSTRSVEQVTREKNGVQHQLDRLNKDLDQKQDQLQSHCDHMQIMRDKVNTLRNEQLELKRQLQRQQQLEVKRAELLEDTEQCKKIIQQDKEQVRPLENKLRQTRDDKENVIRAKECALEEIKLKMDDVRNKIRDIHSINTEIDRYIAEGRQSALPKCERRLQDVKQRMKQQDESIRESSKRQEKIRNDLAEQKVKERELSDNLLLRQKEASMQNIEDKVLVLKEELGGFDHTTLTVEKRKLEQSLEGFKKEKNQVEGRKRELDTYVRTLKTELESDMFKDVAVRYKEKFVEEKTNELACEDLLKYYIALDAAIMKYHSMKMDEINKIIRELWTNTYKGKDIDYIEIRSEESETAGDKPNMRRAYNYKVVMVKGTIAVEMRGRCSAGQKVLAALVIRLALAETFCLNCGILALDEPTTNLDRENIESLAQALTEIVRSRQAQANFQLVVITHDEDFIELLANSDFVDKIYKVGKNEEGKSVIQGIRLKTMI